MKTIRLLLLLLLIIGLLCGCVASGATLPTDPTAAVLQDSSTHFPKGEPTPQLPADNNQSLDVDPNSTLTYSNFGTLSPLICIRSYDQLIAHYGTDVSDMMPQYDQAFFEDHSLIIVNTSQNNGPYHIEAGNLEQDDSGKYCFELKYYWPEVISPATHHKSLIIVVDHVIASDAIIEYHSTHETVTDYQERFQ